MSEFPWLHSYAQDMWHDTAYLAGTREGIERLRDLLSAALTHEEGVAASEFLANDGEGYLICAYVLQRADFNQMRLPYVGEIAESEEGVNCWQLLAQPKLEDRMKIDLTPPSAHGTD